MTKKRLGILAGMMAAAMALTACGSSGESSGTTGSQTTASQTTGSQAETTQTETSQASQDGQSAELDVLRVGLAALPTDLDPDKSIGIASIKLFYNMFDTLLFTDKEGEICGQLAESWEWQDDTTLNVTLREGVTFQNGEP